VKIGDVEIYTMGLCHASLCAPVEMSREDVLRHAGPSGTSGGWVISDEPFADGAPNPSPCEREPGRQHWLLVC
jgi:hypothetical protein